MQKRLPLLITTGEPAGIGMDIVLLLAAEGKLQDFKRYTGNSRRAPKLSALANCRFRHRSR